MRKQSVRKGVWYIGGRRRKRRQKGRFLPVGAILGSLAGPALGALAGPVVKKKYLVEKNGVAIDIPRQKNTVKMTHNATTSDVRK